MIPATAAMRRLQHRIGSVLFPRLPSPTKIKPYHVDGEAVKPNCDALAYLHTKRFRKVFARLDPIRIGTAIGKSVIVGTGRIADTVCEMQ